MPVIEFARTCRSCKTVIEMKADAERYSAWTHGEGHIQTMLPELSADEREWAYFRQEENAMKARFSEEQRRRVKEAIHQHNATLRGMENAPAERAAARAEAEGQELTAAMRKPKADISAKAGNIERDSPLFWGKGESPTLF